MTASRTTSPIEVQTTPVDHYENFPVASLLCPPALRPAVAAIYHFARTADDIADEGDATPAERLVQLSQYRTDLTLALSGTEASPQRRPLFAALARVAVEFNLPSSLLHDLISAFEQDVRYTSEDHHYRDTAELLAYCKLSANPVGRLLLHLYGIDDANALAQSDHICSALQLINFWQDISVDLPRQRQYLPSDRLKRHGVTREDFMTTAKVDAATDQRKVQVVASLCQDARELMQRGAPLTQRIPGRAGWELRLVVQGGLRILDKIEAGGFRTWEHRPTVGKVDAPLLLWRAVWMG
jgi:hydroxysqualene synthase